MRLWSSIPETWYLGLQRGALVTKVRRHLPFWHRVDVCGIAAHESCGGNSALLGQLTGVPSATDHHPGSLHSVTVSAVKPLNSAP